MKTGSTILLSILVALAFAGGCSARPETQSGADSAQVGSEAAASPEAQPLLGYELPLDVASLEDSLGQPDEIQRPAVDDASPVGQWLTWNRPDGTTFKALADDYSLSSTDPGADVRYIELLAATESDSGDTTTTPVVYGMILNETVVQEVDASLPESVPSMVHARPEIDSGGVYDASILYERDGLYTYFFFDDSGVLMGVGQSVFPVDAAG